MSYRSFKHIIGETNLERKCRFWFGLALLVLITASFLIYGWLTENLVYKQNSITGRLLVDTIITRIHWQKLNSQAIDQLLAEELANEFSNTSYQASFIQPKPNRSDDSERPADKRGNHFQPIDDFEWEVWRHFAESDTNEPKTRRLTEEQKYQYFQPIRATDKSCLDCHRDRQLGFRGDLGDLMAVAKVEIPDGPTRRNLNWNRAFLISMAIIVVSLAMVISWMIVRYIVAKPLQHLKEVSDAISHGNIDKRAEIRTGDEFEELGRAFNRMLRHLVAVQEELRHVNGDLDGKVDELAQANMALFEMNRLKSDFLATMSHELRTPLNSILGFSEVLDSIDSLDDKQKRYVKNIQKSGKMLLDMINDILNLAKIESGKMELRLADFRIEHVISAQCDWARPLTEKKNIDLTMKVEPPLPLMHQDQSKIQQVLNNLLSNAIKFTPEGGRICVSVHSPDDRTIIMVVEDTGVGIAEEDQEVIFEKFRQGNTLLKSGNAMTREYSGTGLGLSIVKELCKLLGGSVTLKSELGKGSEFTVKLPASLPDQTPSDHVLTSSMVDLSKARRVHFDHGLVSSAGPRAD